MCYYLLLLIKLYLINIVMYLKLNLSTIILNYILCLNHFILVSYIKL